MCLNGSTEWPEVDDLPHSLQEGSPGVDSDGLTRKAIFKKHDEYEIRYLGPYLVYDFSDKNTLDDWNNYAAEIDNIDDDAL